MELRQLRYFVAVAQELSFTRAAGKLRVAQPALSRQIRQLEEELGVRLLERNRRATYLTEPGQVFLAEACGLLEQSERAMQMARLAKVTHEAQLKIGYVWGLFHSVAPAAIHRLRTLLPEVAVHLLDLTAIQQAEALAHGKLDAGFIGFADEAQAWGLARRKVGRCAFLAAVPERHPAARHRQLSLSDLAKEPFVMVADSSYPGASRLASQACERAGFQPRVVQRVERGFAILGLVAGNCGVAVLPEPLRKLPHPGVVFRPLTEAPEGDLFIAWQAARRHPARDTFLKLFE